jgi:uncharacterized membrane protein HdeD (DUF308 family)
MSENSIEVVMNKQLKKGTVLAGILLLIIGSAGIILPMALSIVLSEFIAVLLIASGFTIAYGIWHSHRGSWLAWLKSFVLIMLGLLIGLYPTIGTAALGLLLVIYFFMDGFASISFAFEMRPHKSWVWLLINSFFSFLLAVIFIIGWPFSSIWLVGLFIGISLIFDGIALLSIGMAAKTL